MKKILASAGLVVLGAASIQAADATSQAKPWNVSASLRGFYDDNYATLREDQNPDDSFGFEFRPGAGVNLSGERTTFQASYTFSLKYYEGRPDESTDYGHFFNLGLTHEFSERFRLSLYDDFVVSQEPAIIDYNGPRTVALRTNGDNMRNAFGLDFRADVSRQIAIEPGYSWSWYDFDEEGAGSYSARCDRNEHLFKVALRWKEMLKNTDGILGYNYGMIDYSSDDVLAVDSLGNNIYPDARDNDSHYYFIGADYSASRQLTLSGRFGGQTVNYDQGGGETSPYVDLSGTYRFQETSSFQLGYKYAQIPTDYVGTAASGFVVNQLAHFVYSRVNHTIGGRLTLSAGVSLQFGQFEGGANDGSEDFYLFDLNASYKLNPYLYAEAGYAYDVLNDHGWDDPTGVRDYDRNYVYIGIRGTY